MVPITDDTVAELTESFTLTLRTTTNRPSWAHNPPRPSPSMTTMEPLQPAFCSMSLTSILPVPLMDPMSMSSY